MFTGQKRGDAQTRWKGLMRGLFHKDHFRQGEVRDSRRPLAHEGELAQLGPRGFQNV